MNSRGATPNSFFEGPEEAGVVPETESGGHLVERHSGEDAVLAGVQPLFYQILMDGHAHVVLEYMGNVIFAHIKFPGQGVQTQIFLQVGIDVLTDVGEEEGLLYIGGGLLALVDDAVDGQQQGGNVAVQHGGVESGHPLMFLNDFNQFVEEDLGRGEIRGKMVAADLVAVLVAVGDVRLYLHELLKIFRRQPQYDSPVGTVGVSELGAMEDTRRDQTDISVLERVDIFSDLIGEIPLQKEIDFIVIMPMDRDIGELFILIVKNFKI